MATSFVGNLVTPILPLDTDNSPVIARVIAVVAETSATIQFNQAPELLGDAEPNSIVVPAAEFDALWYDVELLATPKPGALGTLDYGTFGKMRTRVIKTFQLDVAEGQVNPFTGVVSDSGEAIGVLYLEFVNNCAGEPSLQEGGSRITVPATAFTLEAEGNGVSYARVGA
jgi:hypothetical protein